MSKEPVNMPSSSGKAPPGSRSTGKRSSIKIARVMGILCVAVGFMLGIHALEQPGSPLLPTALGLIATGVVAQVFVLVKACFVGSQGKG